MASVIISTYDGKNVFPLTNASWTKDKEAICYHFSLIVVFFFSLSKTKQKNSQSNRFFFEKLTAGTKMHLSHGNMRKV